MIGSQTLLVLCLVLTTATAGAAQDFDRTLAPLLIRHCLDCHSGAKPKGELDLTRRKSMLEGGKSGPAVVPGKPEASLLYTLVASGRMPPKKSVAAADKEALRAWIARGANWGSEPIDPFRYTTDQRAGYDWWSLRPVKTPALPPVRRTAWARNPVDYFVLARLEERGLQPSPEAEPRVLVRRLYFDLLGLPPTPQEVDEFLSAVSARPQTAYEELVDRLLASPHYGERWARHWLDIVRYGESDGFERNNPRPNAWPYRDWIVAALNSDLPYDAFARHQLAGDVLPAPDAAPVHATGFLVAGTHNTVVGSNEVMREFARQDELEDLVAAVGQTFLGLTVHCARCHDHKFDPVGMVDYYRLVAVFAGVGRGERKFVNPGQQKQEAEIRQRLAELERQIRSVQQGRRSAPESGPVDPKLPVTPLARWAFVKDARDDVGTLHGTLNGGAQIVDGRLRLNGKDAFVVTTPLDMEVREKTLEAWVTLSTLEQGGGGVLTLETKNGTTFDAIVFAERQPRKWMAGSNFFRRTLDLAAAEESSKPGQLIHVALAYQADGRITMYRNGLPYGASYTPAGAAADVITYGTGDGRLLMGLRHTGGGRGFLKGELEEARLYDRALSAEQILASARSGPGTTFPSRPRSVPKLSSEAARVVQRLQAERTRRQQELQAISIARATLAYVVNPQPPPPTHVLERGDVQKKLARMSAGGIRALGQPDFGTAGGGPEGDRRRAFAEWVTRPENPLFARVIANRLWHYHFGTGIVETPSDLGFNGSRPSHPELLDWLAAELVEQRYSLKALHRLMVTSATYRQAAAAQPQATAVDASNRLLWRANPRRLEAEALRDAILATAGRLNPALGGPGFQDVRTYFNSGTTFYEPLDPVGPLFERRTLYRFSPRGERSALLETFDCPDPSATTPRRPVTTTPLQALSLLNNSFVLRMADHFAERITAETGGNSPRAEAVVARAYLLAFGRAPSPQEARRATAFTAQHGLPALCRVLLNSTEFVVIE